MGCGHTKRGHGPDLQFYFIELNLKKLKNRSIIERIILDGEIKGFAGMV